MITDPTRFLDPARVALAVDAICTGSPFPILIHAHHDRTTDPPSTPFALLWTPLTELATLHDTIRVLRAVSVPDDWRLVGLCAPTTVRALGAERPDLAHTAAWIVHVVAAGAASATRLCIPEAPELSGPISSIEPTHDLDRCLRRLLGGDQVNPAGSGPECGVATTSRDRWRR